MQIDKYESIPYSFTDLKIYTNEGPTFGDVDKDIKSRINTFRMKSSNQPGIFHKSVWPPLYIKPLHHLTFISSVSIPLYQEGIILIIYLFIRSSLPEGSKIKFACSYFA